MYCKNCGVELEYNMQHCPLCGQSVNSVSKAGDLSYTANTGTSYAARRANLMTQPDKRRAWEIISLTLLAAAATTFMIDFILNKRITWSEYPVAICLIIFSYISLLAFVRRSLFFEIAGGFVISSILLLILDALTQGISWAFRLGIPLLLSVNLLVAAFIGMIRRTKHKGINLIAWGFIAAGILCICTEAILSLFRAGALHLQWSVIVMCSIIPVSVVLFYMHTRLRKGRNLERTFHV